MKRFILTLILLLVICGIFFYALSMPRDMGDYHAVNGVLDLTNADFSSTRHSLNGQWEFYYGQLLTPEDFSGDTVTGQSIIEVPGSWDNFGYPVQGYATYRLIIKTNEPSLMMLVPQIPSASIVWINGERVHGAGVVTTEAPGVHGADNAFVAFYPIDGQVEIVIQASNYIWLIAGLRYHIEIGQPSILLGYTIMRHVLVGIFIGVLAAMFIYHLILFLHNRKEWAYFAFALFCITTAVQFFMEINGLYSLFFGFNSASRTVFQFVMTLKVVALVMFTHVVLRIPLGRIRLSIYCIVLGVSLISAYPVAHGMINPLINYVPLIPMFMVLFSAFNFKRTNINFYNLAFIVALAFLCVLHPLQWYIVGSEWYMVEATPNLLLVLTQFFILSISYAKTKATEQRLATENANLDSLSRMKTEYITNLTHETKTPLTVISNQVQQARDVFEKITNESDYNGTKTDSDIVISSLIRAQSELMRVSRVSTNALWLASTQENKEQMKPLDIGALVTNTTEAYRSIIEKQDNALSINIPKNLPQILGESDQLVQVMMNLLSNAKNHTTGGAIIVNAQLTDNFITVTVKDNGAGIPPELLPRVFERGVTGSKDKGGTGMGLPISKSIIESHSGSIAIDSICGESTTVIFKIPVYSDTNNERTVSDNA